MMNGKEKIIDIFNDMKNMKFDLIYPKAKGNVVGGGLGLDT